MLRYVVLLELIGKKEKYREQLPAIVLVSLLLFGDCFSQAETSCAL